MKDKMKVAFNKKIDVQTKVSAIGNIRKRGKAVGSAAPKKKPIKFDQEDMMAEILSQLNMEELE
jgi:hypothetical protein